MAQGTRGLVASACLLPNLVMTAAEWAGDQVQGPGASRECFDARDPIPQRECKPLRKPADATWGEGAICSAASGAADIGKGRSSHRATSPVCWIEESNKTLGGRTGQEEASWRGACCRLQGARCKVQHHMCMWGGESRMPYFYPPRSEQQPVEWQGPGWCEGRQAARAARAGGS